MQEENIDLLDLGKNIDFLFDIIKGKEENFIKLESWYKEKNKNKSIDSYKQNVFRLIEFAYLQNKEKKKNEKENLEKKNVKNQNAQLEDTNLNINLDAIMNKINELIKNDEQKTKKIDVLIKNDEQKTKKIDELIKNDEKKTDEIMILKEDQIILNTKYYIMKFINDVQNYINKENNYYNDIHIFCLEQKNILQQVDIYILRSLTIDLYSYKNLCVYRKISYLLLKEIITEKKKCIIYNNKFKSINKDQNLDNIISFFFWVKQSISELIHFSIKAKDLYDSLINQKKQENINLIKEEDIKNTNDYLEKLKDCSYEDLIDCLDKSTPLLLFNETAFKKTTIESFINNLLSKVKIGKRNEIVFYQLSSKLLDLKTQLNKIKTKIGDLKGTKDDILIKEFQENAEYIEKKTISENEHNKLTIIKKNITDGIENAKKYKESIKANYFTFNDFTEIFIKEKNLVKFNPATICKKILDKRLQKKVNFAQDEQERLEDILIKKK